MLNTYLQILFERQQAFDLLGYFPLFEQFLNKPEWFTIIAKVSAILLVTAILM